MAAGFQNTKLRTVKRSYLYAGLFLAAIVLWLLSGLLTPGDEPLPPGLAATERQLTSVRVRDFDAQLRPQIVVVQGSTAPERSVTLRAETSGQVVQLGEPRGTTVEAGAPILRLDQGDRPARLSEARAQLAQRRLEWEAAEQLGARDYVARTRVAEARADLEEAQARLATMEREIRNTIIRAPFSGVLENRPVELGDYVAMGDPVATMVELDPLKVVAEIPETLIDGVVPGLAAQARLVDGRILNGIISYVASTASPETRTFPVEVRADNPGRIPAGLTAELRVAREGRPAHQVPASALTLDDDGRIGLKSVDGQGLVAFHPVSVVGEEAGRLWVTGLPERVRIITLGQEWVVPGQQVMVVVDDD